MINLLGNKPITLVLWPGWIFSSTYICYELIKLYFYCMYCFCSPWALRLRAPVSNCACPLRWRLESDLPALTARQRQPLRPSPVHTDTSKTVSSWLQSSYQYISNQLLPPRLQSSTQPLHWLRPCLSNNYQRVPECTFCQYKVN